MKPPEKKAPATTATGASGIKLRTPNPVTPLGAAQAKTVEWRPAEWWRTGNPLHLIAFANHVVAMRRQIIGSGGQ